MTDLSFTTVENGARDERRRAKLLAIARLFAERGYGAVSLDDIARELKITRTALYYYAESKEDLLVKCAEPAMAAARKAVREAQLQSTGAAKLRVFFRSYLRTVCSELGRCLAMVDIRDLSPEGVAKNRAYRGDLTHAVEAMVLQGISDQSLSLCEPSLVRRALFATSNSFSRWYRPERGIALDSAIDGLLQLFFQGLEPRNASTTRSSK